MVYAIFLKIEGELQQNVDWRSICRTLDRAVPENWWADRGDPGVVRGAMRRPGPYF